jgi:hypothetical protein
LAVTTADTIGAPPPRSVVATVLAR